MSSPAHIPRGGPRTQAGKAQSCKNAITHGLFTAHDLILPGEQPLHSELTVSLRTELAPSGPLEIHLADEIRSAMWRLRRCGLIEESFSAAPTASLQRAVDRARSHAHRVLHKSTAALRKLQTERQLAMSLASSFCKITQPRSFIGVNRRLSAAVTSSFCKNGPTHPPPPPPQMLFW